MFPTPLENVGLITLATLRADYLARAAALDPHRKNNKNNELQGYKMAKCKVSNKLDESKKTERGSKKDELELRKRVSLSFTKKEFVELDKVADQYKMNRSEFVRCAIFGNLDEAIKKISQIEAVRTNQEILRLISITSNNLNQIARKINFEPSRGVKIEELDRILSDLKRVAQNG